MRPPHVVGRTGYARCALALIAVISLACGQAEGPNSGAATSDEAAPGAFRGSADIPAAQLLGDFCNLAIEIDGANPQNVTGELVCFTRENGGLVEVIVVRDVVGEVVSDGFAEGWLAPEEDVSIPWSAALNHDRVEFVWSRGLSPFEVAKYFEKGAIVATRDKPGRCEVGSVNVCLGRVPLPASEAGAVVRGSCPAPCGGQFFAECDGAAWRIDTSECLAGACAETAVEVCGGEVEIDALGNGESVELHDVCAPGCLEFDLGDDAPDYVVTCNSGVILRNSVVCHAPAFDDCDGDSLPVCGGQLDVPDMPSGASLDYLGTCAPGCFDDDVADPVNYTVRCVDGALELAKEQCN